MAQETERKFLVRSCEYRKLAESFTDIRQGYISRVPERTVRIRIRDSRGYITIKGKSSADGASRYEWEHEIPLNEAEELLSLCENGIIEKRRYIVPYGKHLIEIDEFHGRLEGRTLAEIELQSENEEIQIPDWLGEEVTGNPEYYNSNMNV